MKSTGYSVKIYIYRVICAFLHTFETDDSMGGNMKTFGKSINLYLMDGDPTERIKASLANWTGVAHKIPRTAVENSKDIELLRQSGVYFLFGTDDLDSKDVVYIGQAGIRSNGEGILYRLQEHKRSSDKEYWTEAVIFTTSNNSFGPTEISYLENKFYQMAKNAKRYEVKNGNNPSPGHITEEKESELLEFIENAKVIMGALGYKVFEPYIEKSRSRNKNPILHYKTKFDAKDQRTSEGFVILKGSEVSRTLQPSCPDNVRRFREKYQDKINSDFKLLEDILVSSPSAAAGFVGGASLSGNVFWLDNKKRTLKELEAEEDI